MILVLEKINSPQEENESGALQGLTPPMGVQIEIPLCTFFLLWLSHLWPSYCVMSLQAWPAKRRGAAPALVKKKKEKQVAVPLRSFLGAL